MISKSESTISKKTSRSRRIFSLCIFYGIFLVIMLWKKHLSQKDIILFTTLLIGTGIFFEIIERFKWYQDLPVLFQRMIYYGILIPLMSMVVPILDVLIMSASSIVFELEAIFNNAESQ